MSRMTLHRRGVSREALLAALAEQLEREYREALWPALTAPGSALERLELALRRCATSWTATSSCSTRSVTPSATSSSTSSAARRSPSEVFTEPVQRLLADGAADGSLTVDDPEETATVLFNLVGHTYRHLRAGHGWSPKRTREAVLDLALRGVVAR